MDPVRPVVTGATTPAVADVPPRPPRDAKSRSDVDISVDGSPLVAGVTQPLDPTLYAALKRGDPVAIVDRIETLNARFSAGNRKPLTADGVEQLIASEDAAANRRTIDGQPMPATHTAAVYYVVDRFGAAEDSVDVYTIAVSPRGSPYFGKATLSNAEFQKLGQDAHDGVTIRSSGRQEQQQRLNGLGVILVEPMQDWLADNGITQLLVVPSGELMEVPFCALMVKSGKESDGLGDEHAYDYVFERFTTAQVASVTSLATEQSNQLETAPSVAVATARDQGMTSQYFEREGQWILDNVPNAKGKVGTVESARDLHFTRNAKIALLSFHAASRDRGGVGLALPFVDEPHLRTDPGVVTTGDLQRIYEGGSTRLLILNGCETAQPGRKGEASMAFALTRSVDTVVGALFATNGEADALFTRLFFDPELRGQSVAERVQGVMLALSEQEVYRWYRNPYYFSAYTIYGSPWLRW